MKTLTSIRIAEITANQIQSLKLSTGLNQSEIVALAVDRMYAENSDPKSVDSPIRITITRRTKLGYNYTASQPLETPIKPYHIGTWKTINERMHNDLTLESFRGSGVYWTSAWFVRYQGEWWRVRDERENNLPELDYNDTTEVIVERM